ncbi:unnamed protein product [Medioppia subpectinata]|uniref:Ig-like domain-containing protein n=1 Tax=Medioppia subpectinata TaxID=1979941 RepID=A0A7R9LC80_9ACAR|nr:unnamed protein product [Medioppia subpectinata]CAG2117679.1 unnamed protein product [Medioppia subpectinata]
MKCSSIISQIYGVNFEELVIEENGRYAGLQQTEGDYETLGQPYSPPQIHGHNNKYSIDDIVYLNCTTPVVSPPPLLEWFINGREISHIYCIYLYVMAPNSQLIIFSKPKEPNDNLMFSSTIYDNFADFDAHRKSSVLGLRFQITKEHYQTSDGKLRLRCSATHATIIGTDRTELVLFSGGRQSSSLFASDATANDV